LRRNTLVINVTTPSRGKDMARSFRISPRGVGSLMLTIAAAAVGSGFAGGGANAATSGPASSPFLAHQALY
jgi:hypothetical protein